MRLARSFWRILEMALAGDSFWRRCQNVLRRSEDRALLDALSSDRHAFLAQCLRELRTTCKAVLLDPVADARDPLRDAGAFARFDATGLLQVVTPRSCLVDPRGGGVLEFRAERVQPTGFGVWIDPCIWVKE